MERNKLESQIAFYQPYQELLDGIDEYLRQQREDDLLDENDDYEDNENQHEDEENDDLKLETTEIKDINDFIKESKKEAIRETGLMDKKALFERIGMLNIQQRQIFDDIVSRLMSGNFDEIPFLIYIR